MDKYTATELAYKNGYEKGYADAKAELVHCKDCKYGEYDYTECFEYYECHYIGGDWNRGDHYCGYGERKEEAVKE